MFTEEVKNSMEVLNFKLSCPPPQAHPTLYHFLFLYHNHSPVQGNVTSQKIIESKLSKILHRTRRLVVSIYKNNVFKYLRLWSCLLICKDRSSLSVYFSAYVSSRSLHLLIFIIYNFPLDMRQKIKPTFP